MFKRIQALRTLELSQFSKPWIITMAQTGMHSLKLDVH